MTTSSLACQVSTSAVDTTGDGLANAMGYDTTGTPLTFSKMRLESLAPLFGKHWRFHSRSRKVVPISPNAP
jgi:hypothetical protein